MGVSNAVGVWGFQNRANDLSAHLDELKKTLYERGRALGVRPKSAVPIEVSTGMSVRERVVMGVAFDGRVGGDVFQSSMNRARMCCVSLLQCVGFSRLLGIKVLGITWREVGGLGVVRFRRSSRQCDGVGGRLG